MANVYSCVFHGTTRGDGGACGDCNAEKAANAKPTAFAGAWTSGYLMSDVGSSEDMVVVFGSPIKRRQQAVETVNKALGDGELDCTEPARSPADILSQAINRAEAMLPHGIELRCERSVAWRTHDVTASCPHCGVSVPVVGFADHVLVPNIGVNWIAERIVDGVRGAMRTCISAACCDPLDRFVDGLRVRECLERYEAMQRSEGQVFWHMDVPFHPVDCLTQLQLTAARSAWSAQLRAKQQEARERERGQVVCERDEDGL